MTVADDGVNAGQRSDLLRRALGVASGDQDACGWIFAMDFAQKGTGGTIRLGSHTAGVGDDHVGPAGAQGRGQAAVAQLGAYDFAVGPAGSASEVLDVIFCHVASLLKERVPAQTNAISGRIRSGDQYPP